MNGPAREVDPVNGVTGPESEPQAVIGSKIQRAWSGHGCVGGERGTIRRRFAFSIADQVRDVAGCELDLAHAVIAYIRDVEVPVATEAQTVGFAQLGLGRRTAIAGIAARAISREGGNHASLHVELANDMVQSLDPAHVSRAIETYFIRLVEFGGKSRSAVSGEALLPVARHGADPAVAGHFSDPMIHRVADVERAIRSASDAIWIGELRRGRRAAVAGKTFRARAGKRRDLCRWEHG